MSIFYQIYNLRDGQGVETCYEAVSVVEYKGRLNRTGESHGHYNCDVKDNTSKIWFRTNDGRDPVQLSISEVSKNGYVVLYKRSQFQ